MRVLGFCRLGALEGAHMDVGGKPQLSLVFPETVDGDFGSPGMVHRRGEGVGPMEVA